MPHGVSIFNMSTYATMSGELQYASEDAFKVVANQLRAGGWANERDWFVDETGEEFDDGPHLVPELLSITIPWGVHRNLCRVEFFAPQGTTGQIIGTCTDGCFEGWIENEFGSKTYDLAEFYEEDEWPDEDTDEYLEAQGDAENSFWNNPPEPPTCQTTPSTSTENSPSGKTNQ